MHVKRPDVECTNGVIHVIDTVMMLEGDVNVNRGESLTIVSVTVHLAVLLAVKFLL